MLKTQNKYKQGILKAVGINGFAKIFNLALNLLIAWYFGAALKTDIYFYIVSTSLIFAGFLTSIFTSVIIPWYFEIPDNKRDNFANAYVLLSSAGALIISFFLFQYPEILFPFISGFSSEDVIQNRGLFQTGSVIFFLVAAVNLMYEILNARKLFSAPYIAALFHAILTLTGLILLKDFLGAAVLFYLYAASFFIQLIVIPVTLRVKADWKFSVSFSAYNKRITGDLIYSKAGHLITAFASYLPYMLISGLSAGTLTSLILAERTVKIFESVILAPYSNIIAVKYNELSSVSNKKKLAGIFEKTAAPLIYLMFFITLVAALLNDEIVALLFQRGGFSASDAEKTSGFLFFLAFLLPPLAINTVTARVFMAQKLIKISSVYQTLMMTAQIFLIWALFSFFEATGYIYALLVVYWGNAFIIGLLFLKYIPFIRYKTLALYTSKMFAVIIAVYLPLYRIPGSTDFPLVVEMAAVALIALALFITLSMAIKKNRSFLAQISGRSYF